MKAVELIDDQILRPCLAYLKDSGEPFKIMVLPDHPTPLCKRTHTHEAVPFFIYDSEKEQNGVSLYSEANCAAQPLYVPNGDMLMEYLTGKKTML